MACTHQQLRVSVAVAGTDATHTVFSCCIVMTAVASTLPALGANDSHIHSHQQVH